MCCVVFNDKCCDGTYTARVSVSVRVSECYCNCCGRKGAFVAHSWSTPTVSYSPHPCTSWLYCDPVTQVCPSWQGSKLLLMTSVSAVWPKCSVCRITQCMQARADTSHRQTHSMFVRTYLHTYVRMFSAYSREVTSAIVSAEDIIPDTVECALIHSLLTTCSMSNQWHPHSVTRSILNLFFIVQICTDIAARLHTTHQEMCIRTYIHTPVMLWLVCVAVVEESVWGGGGHTSILKGDVFRSLLTMLQYVPLPLYWVRIAFCIHSLCTHPHSIFL